MHRRRNLFSRRCVCGLPWRFRVGCLDARRLNRRPAWVTDPTEEFPPARRARIWNRGHW
ncbi:hypothetical protein [Plantactinospora sp. GCM10030261]|uniref:hypothetical protein n=1 Tax=Plantactinospora sp. GCM10030261 TaxID=3273420 RepID=UPI00361B99F7